MSHTSRVAHLSKLPFNTLLRRVHTKRHKPPKPRKYIRASEIPAKIYNSYQHHNQFFARLPDADNTSSDMFTFTTVCHKTSDTQHPLLMLQTREGSKYLFGKVPEGAQRALNENGMRLGKLRSVFLTGNLQYWSEIGGLPGLFLTTSDATSRGLDVYTNCSKTLSYIVATWRYFVFRKGIELNIAEPQEGQVIGDSSVVLFPVKVKSDQPPLLIPEELVTKFQRQLKKITSLMFPRDTSIVNSDNPESYKSDPSETEIQTHVELPDPVHNLGIKDQAAISYIARLLPVRGKFNPKKAIELGVKPGVDFRTLTRGERVLTEKGTYVEPEQVLEPPHTFPKILILDIPNVHFLSNTLASDEWFAKSESRGQEEYGAVYHFLGDDIDFTLREYVEFMAKFPPDCKHIISHSRATENSLVFLKSTVHNLKLKCLMNDNFCLPLLEGRKETLDSELIGMKLLQTMSITPSSLVFDESNTVEETWQSLFDKHVNETEHNNVELEALLAKRIIPLDPVSEASCVKDHVQVFTLGTGSALPSIHRNVLSNLVRIPRLDPELNTIKYTSILLDGGENTLGSMMRTFGHDGGAQLQQLLQELKLIYLSHLHADHHLGLISVINAWFKANKDSSSKLYLLLPWQFNHFLNEWLRLEGSFADVDMSRIVYLSNETFNPRREPEFQQANIDHFEELFDCGQLSTAVPRKPLGQLPHSTIQELYDALLLEKIETVRAVHCYWAYSVSMTFQISKDETFKVSFSGDTRPNPNFYRCGHNSDLLIHEASLDDDLIEEALAKKHTTTTEAVRMAQLMKCPKVLLTHFSTRNSEKHTFIRNREQYERQCQSIDKYLGNVSENIMKHETDDDFTFDDMEVCYGYDTMAVRYQNFGFQKPHYDAIMALSPNEEDEKMEKERLKMMDKRLQKREKRLQHKKMKIQGKK